MKRFASIFLQLLCTCFLFSTYQSLFAGFFSVSFNSGAQVFNAEVLTEDRGFIDICEIYRNRKIESISPKNGSRLISKVVDTVQHLDFFLLFLSFHKPEENPQILVLTADQVLCNADGRWIMAKDIVDGTTLFGKTGDVTVTDIGSMRFAEKGDELQTSYSIELADFGQKTPHSFFVKGSSCSSNKAVLVHNGIPSRREYMSPAFDHLRSKYDYLTLFPNKHPCSGGCHSSEFSNDPVAALATLACMGLAAYYGPQGNRPSIDQVLPVMVEPGPQNIDDFGYSDDYVEVAKLRHKNQQIKIQAEQEIQRDAEKKRRAKVLEFRAQQKAQRERKHAEKALAFEKEKRQQEENQKQINVLRYCALKKILEQSQNFFSKRQRELIDSACCYSGLLGCVAAFAGAPAAVAFPMLSISNANIWCRSGTAAARLLCQGYYKMFVGNEKLFETNWKQDCSTLAQHGFWCLLPGLIACASKNLANPLKTLRKNTSKTIIGSAFKKSLKVAKKTYKIAKRFLIKGIRKAAKGIKGLFKKIVKSKKPGFLQVENRVKTKPKSAIQKSKFNPWTAKPITTWRKKCSGCKAIFLNKNPDVNLVDLQKYKFFETTSKELRDIEENICIHILKPKHGFAKLNMSIDQIAETIECTVKEACEIGILKQDEVQVVGKYLEKSGLYLFVKGKVIDNTFRLSTCWLRDNAKQICVECSRPFSFDNKLLAFVTK